MEVIDAKTLSIKTKKYERLVESIPTSEFIEKPNNGIAELAVPWTLQNARTMAAIGIRCITPIVRDYDFPARFEPMPHQLRLADFLSRYRRAYGLADMGTGKTISAIWAAEYLRQQGTINRVLVVAPKTVMRAAWLQEFSDHMPMLPVTLLHAARAKRIKLAKTPTPWHIINHDGVGVVRPELVDNQYDLIIVDESTAYKNESTNRWSALRTLVRPETILWFLTGTPTPQGPPDAYGQVKLMGNCPVLPKSRTAFLMRTMYQVAESKWVPKHGSKEYVNALMQPAFRVAKRDVLQDLPPVTYLMREVEMGAAQRKHFNEVKKTMQTETLGHTITAANAAVRLSKLVQIAAGSVYASVENDKDEKPIIDFPIKARISATIEAIEQSNSKTIVLFEHKHTMERVIGEIRKAGFSVAAIHGGVSVTERQKILSEFDRQPQPEVLCAIARTMSHGVTATAASTTIWFAPVMSCETYIQANNRTDRPGQKHSMSVVHVFGSRIEKELYDRLTQKKEDQDSLLELYNRAVSELD